MIEGFLHADHVGSLLRPRRLKDAARARQAREIDEAAFNATLDDCIREAVRLQEDAGLRSITDGEFRRGSWFAVPSPWFAVWSNAPS